MWSWRFFQGTSKIYQEPDTKPLTLKAYVPLYTRVPSQEQWSMVLTGIIEDMWICILQMCPLSPNTCMIHSLVVCLFAENTNLIHCYFWQWKKTARKIKPSYDPYIVGENAWHQTSKVENWHCKLDSLCFQCSLFILSQKYVSLHM